MKKFNLHILIAAGLMSIPLFFSACAEEADNGSVSLPITGLIIHNRSQFEIEHLFVYDPALTYQGSGNLIDSNLEVNEMVLHELRGGEYLVTVTRRQNATGDLLAYTISTPILLDKPKVIEYYDTEFRVYDLKLTIPTLGVISVDDNTTIEAQKAALAVNSRSVPTVDVFPIY